MQSLEDCWMLLNRTNPFRPFSPKEGRIALVRSCYVANDGMMTKRIAILGGGTGGTLTANRLRHLFPEQGLEIVVVDQNDDHVYQPGLLFVPFGLTHTDEIVRSRHHQLHRGIEFRQAPIERVDIDTDTVHLGDGTEFTYDVLIVASGCILVEEETEGLTGPGWIGEGIHLLRPRRSHRAAPCT